MNKNFLYTFSMVFILSVTNLRSSSPSIEDSEVDTRSPSSVIDGSFKGSSFQYLPKELVLEVIKDLDLQGFKNFKITCVGAATFSRSSALYQAKKIRHVLRLKEDILPFIALHLNQGVLFDFKKIPVELHEIEMNNNDLKDYNDTLYGHITNASEDEVPNEFKTLVVIDKLSQYRDVSTAFMDPRDCLKLSETKLTNDMIGVFSNHSSLKNVNDLHLSESCYYTTDCLKFFPNLRRLDLFWFSSITDFGLMPLENICQPLSINLTGCSHVSDEKKQELHDRGHNILD